MGKGREGFRKANKCGVMGELGEAVGSHAKHLIKVRGKEGQQEEKTYKGHEFELTCQHFFAVLIYFSLTKGRC